MQELTNQKRQELEELRRLRDKQSHSQEPYILPGGRDTEGEHIDIWRPPSAGLSSVRLTNSEILRAQHIKKKHELGSTPNYLATQDENKKKMVNLVDGKPSG